MAAGNYGDGGAGGGMGGGNNSGGSIPIANVGAVVTANNAARAASTEGARPPEVTRAGADAVSNMNNALQFSPVEDPCSLGNLTEPVQLERVFPDPEQEEPVEIVYPVPPEETVFLVPDDLIRTNYDRVSRTKTLVNQGLYFDVSESMMTIRNSNTSFLGFTYVRDLYSRYPERPNDNSMGMYGNLFPYLAYRTPEAYPGFYLYPIMSNLANQEAADDVARNNIDTLRYTLRRSWMRHRNGAAIYQKSTPRSALESPFDTYVVDLNHFPARTRINLLPKSLFFPAIPPAPFHFNHMGVAVHQDAQLTEADWNAFSFSRLDAYVLGPLHPDYDSWNAISKQVFAKPLVPIGREFKDHVHDVSMPFYEKELDSLPPGRILDVQVRVGSNFISDNYRNYNGSETNMRDVYSSYRMDKEPGDAVYRPAGQKVKFTPYNVKEFENVASEKKNQFPMYVNIEFSTHHGTKVCRFIKNSRLEERVMSTMVRSFNTKALEDRERTAQYARSGIEDIYAEILDESAGRSRRIRRSRETPRENDKSVQGQERSTIDVLRWFESLSGRGINTRSTVGFPLGIQDDEEWNAVQEAGGGMDAALYALRKAVFINATTKLIQSKFRNYTKLLQGEKAYSETIGYRIDKFSVINGEESLIQSFYILDNDETDRVNFVDSQVKYRREYVYRIYAYNFVVGTKYRYSKLSTADAEDAELVNGRRAIATATLESNASYVYDASRDEFGPYRPVAYRNDEPIYADVHPKTPIPADLVGQIQKLPVQHPFFDNDNPPEWWRDMLVRGREPALIGTPEIGIPIWTVPVSRGTISLARPPSEEEIMAEWRNRESAARAATAFLVYPRVAESLYDTQINRRHWWNDREVGGRRSDSVSDPLGNEVFDLTAPNVFGHAHGGGGTLEPFYVDVKSEPHAVFIEVPFFEKRVTMEDAPPVFPQVHIVPFKGETDVVRINLTSNSGEYNMEPIALNEEDEEIFEAIIQAQDPADGKIKFKSDDPPVSYEVFRMTQMPTSVRDFADSKIADVYATGTGGVYDDAIEPNVVYYYIFRAVDAAGHVSNPTDIYQCQLVTTENGMFLDVTTLYEPDMMADKVEKKSLMKTFTIKPALIQKMFQTGEQNRDLTGDEPLGMPPPGGPEIGLFQKSIWDKTYKVRIKSKNSGKTYDINLKFKKKVVDLTEDELQEVTPAENPLNTPLGEGSEFSRTGILPVARTGGFEFFSDGGNPKSRGLN